jgi:hypothetical protein
MSELQEAEIVDVHNEKRFQIKEIKITTSTDRTDFSNIMMAYNYAKRGEGWISAAKDSRKAILFMPEFYNYQTTGNEFYDVENSNPKLETCFNHKNAGDILEGDRSLVGTEWLILSTEVSKGRKVDLIVPVSGLTEEEKTNALERTKSVLTEKGIKTYLDGVERYCAIFKPRDSENEGYDSLDQTTKFTRRLSYFLYKSIFPDNVRDNKVWELFTQQSKNKNIPRWFKHVQISNFLGGSWGVYNRIRRQFDLRFKDFNDAWNEPFVLMHNDTGVSKINLVVDGVSPLVAERGIKLVGKCADEVFLLFPKDHRPKNLSVLYSELMKGPRQGWAPQDVAVATIDYKKGLPDEDSEATMRHEIVHASLYKLFGECKSSWLIEGMAMYLGSNRSNLQDSIFCSDFSKPEYLDSLEKYEVDDSIFEYHAGELLVAFIDKLYGREFLFDFYKSACDQKDLERKQTDVVVLKKVVESMLPISFEDFNKNFRDFVEDYSKIRMKDVVDASGFN